METILQKIRMRAKAARKSAKQGWTFMETLITIAIVLLLTGTVGFMSFQALGTANTAATKSQIESFVLALNSYYFQNRTFPTAEQGLNALWEKPTSAPIPENWNGPYVSKPIPKDPWGKDYVYEVPGPGGLPFVVKSYGRNGMPGGEGEDSEISSAE